MTATLPAPSVPAAPVETVDPARVCAECVPGCYGPPCTSHFIAADVEFEQRRPEEWM